MKTKRLLLLLALVFGFAASQAQVQISLNADANPNPRISEWMERNETVILTITNSNPALEGTRYRIRFQLHLDNTLVADNNPNSMPVRELITGAEVLMADEVLPASALNFYGNIKDKVIRTGLLPAGTYKLCVSLLDMNNSVISVPSEVCRPMIITSYQIPEPIWPSGDVSFQQTQLQGSSFTWSPMAPTPPATLGLKYQLVVSEVYPHQSPSQALLVNYPLVDVEVTGSTSLLWPYDADVPEEGKRYVWSVRALTLDDQPWFAENSGFTTPATFRVEAPEALGNIGVTEIKYRFILMYPDGTDASDKAIETGKGLEKAFESRKIIKGKPNTLVARPSSDVSGSGSANEDEQIADMMFSLIESGGGIQAGSGVVIISAKLSPCPPYPCGCKQDNSVTFYCNCSFSQGFCWCMFCPDFCELKSIEMEDPVLTLGRSMPPPVTTDSVEVKDVIVMMMNPDMEEKERVQRGILSALEKVQKIRLSKEGGHGRAVIRDFY